MDEPTSLNLLNFSHDFYEFYKIMRVASQELTRLFPEFANHSLTQ